MVVTLWLMSKTVRRSRSDHTKVKHLYSWTLFEVLVVVLVGLLFGRLLIWSNCRYCWMSCSGCRDAFIVDGCMRRQLKGHSWVYLSKTYQLMDIRIKDVTRLLSKSLHCAYKEGRFGHSSTYKNVNEFPLSLYMGPNFQRLAEQYILSWLRIFVAESS